MRWRLTQTIYYILSSLCLFGCQSVPDNVNQSLADTDVALAMNYLQRQQWDLAKEYLIQAKKIMPSYPVVWYSLAYYEEKVGNIVSADLDYQYAIQLAPHLGEAHNNYGVFLCRQNYYNRAMQQFSMAGRELSYSHRDTAKNNAAMCKKLFYSMVH